MYMFIRQRQQVQQKAINVCFILFYLCDIVVYYITKAKINFFKKLNLFSKCSLNHAATQKVIKKSEAFSIQRQA